MKLLCFAGVVACFVGGPVMAQSIDFGDDSGSWSNDGECDDPRFEGPGMTSTTLLDEDIRRDATDCRTAFKAGSLTLRGEGPADLIVAGVNFGNDNGEWANDGECDDPRFAGAGMASPPLSSTLLMLDATDCSTAFMHGQLRPIGVNYTVTIDFGDDNGEWSNDNECDDMRFAGAGMTATPLLSDDIMHDATDCETAFLAGQLTLVGE